MAYSLKNIESIQLEISNKCNARCPQCPRNDYGGKTIKSLSLHDISLFELQSFLPLEDMNNLNFIYFCGTYGDPVINKELLDMCAWIKRNNIKIGIHTNGSIQNIKWWRNLAKILTKDDFVAFSLDGLEDTNNIYRQGTSWKKIIKNASTFINHGGVAYWDFIVFKHNEHQVNEAKNFSKDLGFAKFSFKKTSRFVNKKHEIIKKFPIKNLKGDIIDFLEMPNNDFYKNKQIDCFSFKNINNYVNNTEINCHYKKLKQIYIGADGYVFPCGWLHDRLYGIEAEEHPDHNRLKNLFNKAGGIKKVNVFYNTLKNIVDKDWFPVLEKNWTDKNKLHRCGVMCGKEINLIKDQNTEISYI